MEIGKFGGPHIHMLISHIDNIDLVIKEAWHKTIADLIVKGRNYVNIAPFDMDGAEDVRSILRQNRRRKGWKVSITCSERKNRKRSAVLIQAGT